MISLEHVQQALAQYPALCVVAGLGMVCQYPLFMEHFCHYIIDGKRSLNQHLYNKNRPDDYWFVVYRSMFLHGLMNGVQLYCFANNQIPTALQLMYRARYLMLLCCGEKHPDVALYDVSTKHRSESVV